MYVPISPLLVVTKVVHELNDVFYKTLTHYFQNLIRKTKIIFINKSSGMPHLSILNESTQMISAYV